MLVFMNTTRKFVHYIGFHEHALYGEVGQIKQILQRIPLFLNCREISKLIRSLQQQQKGCLFCTKKQLGSF